jgi:predicted glutamine amidotransferase
VYTDGRIAVGLRYVTDRSTPLTMYYSEGKKYVCTDNVCRMVRGTDKKEHAAMIVSEKLTDIADDFTAVPEHHFVLVDAERNVSFRPVKG